MAGETIRFIVDGVDVDAVPGQSILEACDVAGIYIPRLCYHPDLEPGGNCRLCTCNVNGRNIAACITPAAQGMRVENNTARASIPALIAWPAATANCRRSAIG